MNYADVWLPLPLPHPFTYIIPPGLSVVPGHLVEVSLGRRHVVGVIGFLHEKAGHQVATDKEIKEIIRLLDSRPVVTESMFECLNWASRYYMTPLGEVLSTALPSALYRRRRTDSKKEPTIRQSPFAEHWETEKEVSLNAEQEAVYQALAEKADARVFHPALLFGITGSGKTEIYLKLLQQVLLKSKTALFLVPEIGLTPQVVARFRQVFGEKLALYHSGLTENQRLHEWRRCLEGSARVVVGTRSALFAPLASLGLIIIDEEHDASYKQEERFRYHARDLGLVRGKIENAVVLLGSATPSLESFSNARAGKYRLFTLRERPTQAVTPQIRLIDMAAYKRQTKSVLSLCSEMHEAIAETLRRKEQALVLINRRGFASSFFCLACEKSHLCPNCSVSLTYHRHNKQLLCHYCAFETKLPSICPSCGSRETTLLGLGTETVEEELKTWFPRARLSRLDRDSTQKKGYLLQTLKRMKEGKIDILVGTQMVAKGHDIPNVTLVGVLGIDAGLGLPDFRAAEKSFQLLTQVAGRAGRAEKPGRVIVQTFAPDHFSIQCACRNDYERFFEQELSFRREAGYPPEARLIQFRFSSANEKRLIDFMRCLKVHLDHMAGGPAALGPSKAPIEKIRGRFRWQVLLKGKNRDAVQKGASRIAAFAGSNIPSGVQWAVDVDPISML
ncbi:MAG: primosomal protein N' [Deltaproteobacteria bacterium]|nr:primosomal protein N' [Deltaproteobacteria bacterium]